MKKDNPVKSKMIRKMGQPFFNIFGVGQILSLITLVVSIVLMMIVGWGDSWRWIVGSILLIIIFGVFYNLLERECTKRVEEITNEWEADHENKPKSKFQEKLAEMARENAEHHKK